MEKIFEREFLAVITSRTNKNDYCESHHQEALLKFQGSSGIQKTRYRLLEAFAEILTKLPQDAPKLRAEFLQNGFSEEQWLHAVNIVSYFNFTNRLAFALDMKLEEDYEKSCN